MKKCAFIYNTYTNNGKILKYKNEVLDILKEDYSVLSGRIERPGFITDIVKELDDDFDLVISAGGDGTFNQLIKGNIEREKSLLLSHIPCGTANDIGNNFYNTKDMLKITRDILTGKKIDIDTFKMNDNYFIYVAAIGVLVSASFEVTHKSKAKLGYLAYLIGALKELGKISPLDLSYETDSITDKGKYSLILPSNSYSVGGMKFKLLNDSKLCDDMFEFIALKYKNYLQTLIDLIRALSGSDNIKNLTKVVTSKATIRFNETPNKYWSIDGECDKNKYEEVNIEKAGTTKILVPAYTYDKLSI